MLKINSIKSILSPLYAPEGRERVGFVLEGNKIVEVQNVSPEPEEGFLVSEDDIEKWIDPGGCLAVWHTHPGQSSNLSGEDYRTFMVWRNLKHFIIGNDGVRCFGYDEGKKAIMELKDE